MWFVQCQGFSSDGDDSDHGLVMINIIIMMMKSIIMNIYDDDGMILNNQVRQMFNNPVHRRLLARLLKVELEVIPSRFPSSTLK